MKIDKYNDVVFEWIPYSQIDQIKEIGKNDLMTVYSAIWRDGPLQYKENSNYARNLNKKVALKYLHNSQNSIEFVINKVYNFTIIFNYFFLLIYSFLLYLG
jgi:hypothetical protein